MSLPYCQRIFLSAACMVVAAHLTQAAEEDNLRQTLDEAIQKGEKRIVIPPGIYRVSPQKRTHLSFSDLKDVEIVADGVTMICTETTRAITISRCENLTIRGLTIDYDPLPYTQGRITEVAEDKTSMEVQILKGYPTGDFKVGNVEIFDPATMLLRQRNTYFQTTVESTGPGKVKLVKSQPNRKTAFEKVGDIAVFPTVNAPGGAIPHAVYSESSHGLTFENVTLHASPTFGFLENQCDGSKYIGCHIDRCPQESDPVKREFPRLRSTNADGYHSKNSKQGPRIERCTAHFMGDDAVAINGDFHLIAHAEDNKLRVLAKNDLTIQVGDTVQILAYDGARLPNAKVLSIESGGEIHSDERAFLLAQGMDERTKTTMMKSAYTITLDKPISVPLGSVICSADRIGDGYLVKDCDLGMNRSRGIIIKAGRGRILNNTISGSAMESILISPEYWWMEAGLADDVTIDGNRITNGGGMGITIRAQNGTGGIAPAGAFQNITLRNNTITGGPMPSMLITSVKGLTLIGNQLKPDANKKLAPSEIGHGIDGKILPLMIFNCADVMR